MSEEKNYGRIVTIIISIVVIIIGLSSELPGLAIAGGIFVLYAIFLD